MFIARNKQKENLDFEKKKGPTCWEMSNVARYFPFFFFLLISVLVTATLYICYFLQMGPHLKKTTSIEKYAYAET